MRTKYGHPVDLIDTQESYRGTRTSLLQRYYKAEFLDHVQVQKPDPAFLHMLYQIMARI
jgi:hypothetical protein